MKLFRYIPLLLCLPFAACKKNIDLYPESNLNTGTYYSNYEEVSAALTGVYSGLQKPLFYEWQVTELRSDNSKQGSPGSTSSNNRDLSDLDMFSLSTSHQGNYQYWLTTYNNIRNANIVLQKLGVTYDPAAGAINFKAIEIPISAANIKQLAGEALFIRAYHYFNLVRLYGGVFLVYEPISPATAKTMSRATAAEIYKLVEADLKAAVASLGTQKFAQIAATNQGRATAWAAKTLLAKVYLTLNRKAEAVSMLTDVKDNSGYGLLADYANVFSVTNEVNSEILFTIRYKAGGIGLGSPFANMFAPLGSGSAVVLGDGDGLNYPTADLDTALAAGDARRPLLIAQYGSGTAAKLYTKKFLSTLTVQDDAENDWPVLRYADVLLMLAEAKGFGPDGLQLINLVRQRAKLAPLDASEINTAEKYEKALSDERRLEFAFENQRFFDLVRFNTTFATLTAEAVLKDHFTDEYYTHYRLYTAPTPTLAELHANVTRDHLLLPIPQREIDTNTGLVITQNPGY